MEADMVESLRRLIDRDAIADCILRYARGVDRLDEQLLLSAYHEDAKDYHGFVDGSPKEFAAWYWSQQAKREMTQHIVTNQTIDIDGEEAHAESYYLGIIKPTEGTDVIFSVGRYVDRLERRDGHWRIALRVVARETRFDVKSESYDQLLAEMGRATRDRSDPSYQRPLSDPAPQRAPRS